MEDPRRGKVSMHAVGADHPIVVMKVRNGTGAKGMGQFAERGLPTMRMGGAGFLSVGLKPQGFKRMAGTSRMS